MPTPLRRLRARALSIWRRFGHARQPGVRSLARNSVRALYALSEHSGDETPRQKAGSEKQRSHAEPGEPVRQSEDR